MELNNEKVSALKNEYNKAVINAETARNDYFKLIEPYMTTKMIDGVETPWFEPSLITDKSVIDAINLASAHDLRMDINKLILEDAIGRAGITGLIPEGNDVVKGADLEGRINWAETGYKTSFIQGGNWTEPFRIDAFPDVYAQAMDANGKIGKFVPKVLGEDLKNEQGELEDVRFMSLRDQVELYQSSLDKELGLTKGRQL